MPRPLGYAVAILDEESRHPGARQVRVGDHECPSTGFKNSLLLSRLPTDLIVLHEDHKPIGGDLSDLVSSLTDSSISG
jgi:hypothetical protein